MPRHEKPAGPAGRRDDDAPAERPGRRESDAATGRPDRLTALGIASWRTAITRTLRGVRDNNLTDWAAALTYYATLSIFPGLLVLVSVLGLIGQSVTTPLLDNLTRIAPGPVRTILMGSARGLADGRGAASVLAIVGLAGALWTASGYVGAFMRAANSIWDVPEGRPVWRTLPTRLAVTVATGILAAASAFIVVFTGRLAEQLGRLIGAGGTAVTIWGYAKWPVLLLLVAVMLAILYWAAPNARHGGWRWISPGGLLAVLIWIAASAGFAAYAANFGSYNKTYGTLGGIIVFLVWLWISNLAVLIGATFDAELQRARAIAAGMPDDQKPYVALRDTRALDSKPETGTQ